MGWPATSTVPASRPSAGRIRPIGRACGWPLSLGWSAAARVASRPWSSPPLRIHLRTRLKSPRNFASGRRAATSPVKASVSRGSSMSMATALALAMRVASRSRESETSIMAWAPHCASRGPYSSGHWGARKAVRHSKALLSSSWLIRVCPSMRQKMRSMSSRLRTAPKSGQR